LIHFYKRIMSVKPVKREIVFVKDECVTEDVKEELVEEEDPLNLEKETQTSLNTEYIVKEEDNEYCIEPSLGYFLQPVVSSIPVCNNSCDQCEYIALTSRYLVQHTKIKHLGIDSVIGAISQQSIKTHFLNIKQAHIGKELNVMNVIMLQQLYLLLNDIKKTSMNVYVVYDILAMSVNM